MHRTISHGRTFLPVLCCAALFLPACSSGGGDGSSSTPNFSLRTTPELSVAASGPVAIAERWLAFLADEATSGTPGGSSSTDLNGDMDVSPTDSVACVVNLVANSLQIIGVAVDTTATEPLAWIGSRLFLVVDEAVDGRDWNTDMVNERVLLTWSASDGAGLAGVQFVDVMAAGTGRKMRVVDDQLFYLTDATPTAAMESNVAAVNTAAPTVPVDVSTTDTVGGLELNSLYEDEGLLFGMVTESTRTLNSDMDMTDDVLVLLDGTQVAGTTLLRSTQLAVDPSSPLRAAAFGVNDWLVGFLVDEADEGALSLNDPTDFSGSWLPTPCAGVMGFDDTDADDHVLHYLCFVPWNADPVMDPPRNTGIAGTRRIVTELVSGTIGTIVDETAFGENSTAGACDLNGDGMPDDEVIWWVVAPTDGSPIVFPGGASSELKTIANLPGGSGGLVEFDGVWVAAISEAGDGADYNMDGFDHDLIAWLDPGTVAGWQFGGFVAASWLARQPDGAVTCALLESLNGSSLNQDLDTNDAIPTFLEFAGSTLTFPGFPIAVQANNAGIVISKDFFFYRASESSEGRDLNGDMDSMDFVLIRTSLLTGFTTSVGTSSNIVGPAILTDFDATPVGGAILSDETLLTPSGTDINADGDAADLTLRHFRY